VPACLSRKSANGESYAGSARNGKSASPGFPCLDFQPALPSSSGELGAISPSPKSCGQRSATTAKHQNDYEPHDEGGYHHDREAIRSFRKIENGLCGWTRIPRGPPLKIFQLFAPDFGALVKDGDCQGVQYSQRTEKPEAAKSAQSRSGPRPNRGSRAAASSERYRQKATTERRDKKMQSQKREPKRHRSSQAARLQCVSPASPQNRHVQSRRFHRKDWHRSSTRRKRHCRNFRHRHTNLRRTTL